MNYKRIGSSKQRAQRWAPFLALVYLLYLAVPLTALGYQPSAVNHQSIISAQGAQPTPTATTSGDHPVGSYQSPQQLHFTHITTEQGLADNQVLSILQDRAGFLWFGTFNGLARFDGIDTVVYRNNPVDPDSLSGNLIYSLFEDHAGILWVGTGEGLNAYDPRTRRFTHYRHDPNNPNSLNGDSVRAIYEDKSGILWLGLDGDGLDRFDPDKGIFTHYQHDPANFQSLAQNNVYAIAEDHAGNFWVVTYGGLDRLDRDTGQFTHYQHDPDNPESLSSNNSWQYYEDRSGTIWIGTWGGGLDSFDPATGHFTHYRHDPNNPHSLANDQVGSLYEDSAGDLWVGTSESGISVLDPARKSFDTWHNEPSDPQSLSNNRILSMYRDNSGLMWVGTVGGGVNVYNPQQQVFTIVGHDPADPNSLASNSATAIYDGGKSVLWVGTVDAGLDRIDRSTGNITHYPADPGNPKALGHPHVSALLEDSTGELWVGTFGGLYHLDPITGVFRGYKHDASEPKSLSDDTIFGMQLDKSGALWIATDGAGLDRLDPATGIFTHYRHDAKDVATLTGDGLLWVIIDHTGMVWVSSLTGLNRLDPATGRVTRYEHKDDNPASLTSNAVWAIHEDRTGTVWVGTGDGVLHRFDPASGGFVHYTDSSNLTPGPILTILEDQAGSPTERGNLWTVRASGPLSKLAQGSDTLRTYGPADGLPRTVFRQGGVVTGNGMIMIGSDSGLVAFDPAHIKPDPDPPQVVFTRFLLENKPVPIGDNSVLTQDVNRSDTVTLSYADRVISIEFAGLSYRAPQQNRYRYKLEGFDTEWTEVDSTRRLVTYTNLNPGDYTLRVTASNADGVWNDTGRAIQFIITPPWWEMTWFRAMSVLVVMGLAFGIYRLRVGTLERQRSVLEAGIVTRTSALAETNASLQAEIVDRKEAEEALQHTNLQLNKRVSELSALNQIAQALTQWVDLKASLQSIGSTISGLFNGAAIGIWVLDDARLSINRLFAMAHDETLTDNDAIHLSDAPIITQVVSRAQTKVLVPSASQPVIAQAPHLPVDEFAGGTMLLPLQSRNEVIGLLCIRATSQDQVFTPADVALAQTIAGTLANAIENARLFAQAQLDAAEEERKRLAHELHDSVSQALFVANLTADVLPSIWELNPEQGKQALGDMQKFTRSAVAEMRMLLVELRPKALANTPLHDLLQTLGTATATKSHATVETHLDYAPHLSSEVQIALYRVAQEALNNVFKHAKAHEITVILDVTPEYANRDGYEPWSGTITLQIIDDGHGFDPAAASKGRLGLEAMHERAAGINAKLNIISSPGEGTQVVVSWAGHNVPAEVEA